MLLSLVDKDSYDYQDPTHNIILQKESPIVPANGDMIKDGHSLASFNVYRVEGRVFRSVPPKNGEVQDIDHVYLLVSKIAER